jgi:hypothetical protein
MLMQADAMRVIAEKYLKLAKATVEPNERRKFLEYAALYAQLSEQSEQRESPIATMDKEPSKPR